MPSAHHHPSPLSSSSSSRQQPRPRSQRRGTSERKRKLVVSQSPSQPPTTVLRFEISDFEDLSHPKGSFVETRSVVRGTTPPPLPERSWQLRVYPRGHERSRSDKVLVSCFLTARRASGNGTADANNKNDNNKNDNGTDDFEFSFRIKDWRMRPRRCGLKTNLAYGFMGHSRDAILERGLDQDGTLVIDVTLTFWSVADDRRRRRSSSAVPVVVVGCGWHPTTTNGRCTEKKKKRRRMIRHLSPGESLGERLLRSPTSADLTFLVGPSEAVVRAHGCVLAVRAPALLELALHGRDCGGGDHRGGDIPPLELPGVEEDVFRVFLDYVYTSDRDRLRSFVEGGRDGDPGTAFSLLAEADKFGATELKRAVESVLVDRFLSPSNCCEMLLRADSHWCALLKEAASDVYRSDPIAATGEEEENGGWKMLRRSPKLLSELLVVRCCGGGGTEKKPEKSSDRGTLVSRDDDDDDDAGIPGHHRCRRRRSSEDLSVAELRDRLEEAGLDPDGSREMLVRRVAGLD